VAVVALTVDARPARPAAPVTVEPGTGPSPTDDGAQIAERRRAVTIAGHRGERGVAEAARSDPAATVRASALGALARMGELHVEDVAGALADPDPGVRRRAADLAPPFGSRLCAALTAALEDPDTLVVEAVSAALGELGDPAAVGPLATLARDHRDPLCRESAVAALGAIGDPAGLPAILDATSDRAAVRRRAVLALAPFSGPEVDEALARALQDRDWQVRQAAEDLSGDGTAPPP